MIDAAEQTPVYNDNKACVQWSASVTTKRVKYLNLHENKIRECQRNKETKVTFIPGIINPSDIFTKEMKDSAHFPRLRDCFMVSKSVFHKYGQPIPAATIADERILPYYSFNSPTDVQQHSQTLARRVSTMLPTTDPARKSLDYLPAVSRDRGVLTSLSTAVSSQIEYRGSQLSHDDATLLSVTSPAYIWTR